MSSNALARLGEEEGKCWAFGESCRVVPAEVAREVVVALQAERDALAAELAEMKRMTGVALMCNHVARMERAESKLAELEGQEPVAWAVMNGWAIDGIERSEKDAMAVSAERQKSHDLSGSLAAYRVSKLFARPVPAEPVNVDFGKRGENMFFKIGNQSFLLDYKPAEPGEFEFMQKMLLSAFSSITPCVKTASEPVNARLLECISEAVSAYERYGGICTFEGEPMIYASTLIEIAEIAAEAQQAELVDERVIDRTWVRFCGAFGDGPDAPYPGMIAAFETHYGQSFRDKEWRTEAACWAAAWSKAAARAEASLAEPQPDADGPWKTAVIEQLIIAHILTAEHESDPLKAIQDLLAYNSDIAVDPRVSGAAAGLVERTKEACAKACMDEARKWPYPSRGNAAASMCAKMIFDMRQK